MLILQELLDIYEVQDRFQKVTRRFCFAADIELSDQDLVAQVFQRWAADRGIILGDPGDGPDNHQDWFTITDFKE